MYVELDAASSCERGRTGRFVNEETGEWDIRIYEERSSSLREPLDDAAAWSAQYINMVEFFALSQLIFYFIYIYIFFILHSYFLIFISYSISIELHKFNYTVG